LGRGEGVEGRWRACAVVGTHTPLITEGEREEFDDYYL